MSATFINTVNSIFSLGTIVLVAAALLLAVGLISKDKSRLYAWFGKNALILVFLVSLAGVLGSLGYQYIIGFEPCMWCWYQRIAMYPITIITLASLLKRNLRQALDYCLIFSVIGVLLAAFHLLEKSLGKELVPCGVTGPSCLQDLVSGFGFIDIPVMSLAIFAFIALVILNNKRFALAS